MEMLIVMCLVISLCLGLASLITVIALQKITTITILSALVTSVLAYYLFQAGSCARDINLMCKEHASFLRRNVTKMKLVQPLLYEGELLKEHQQQHELLKQLAETI